MRPDDRRGIPRGQPRLSPIPGRTLRKAVQRLLLVLLGLVLGGVSIELGLRTLYPFNRFYVWPPNLRRTFYPDPVIMPGISGKSRFIINSEGIRGDEFDDADRYRILALGGSATECLYLDQSVAWPSQLQRELSAAWQSRVWVGNIGRSGQTTREHILQMQYLPSQYPRIDAAVMMVGVNDLLTYLADPNSRDRLSSSDDADPDRLAKAFTVVPLRFERAEYRKLVLFQKVRQIPWLLRRLGWVQDVRGKIYNTWRFARRGTSRFIEALPDLVDPLIEYRRNLDRIIDLALAQRIRVVLVTQPTLWRANLSPYEQSLLWAGYVISESGGWNAFYSAAALERGMLLYNNELLNICKRRHVECIDAAARLPKTPAAFYDDAHLNANGATLLTKAIVEEFRK